MTALIPCVTGTDLVRDSTPRLRGKFRFPTTDRVHITGPFDGAAYLSEIKKTERTAEIFIQGSSSGVKAKICGKMFDVAFRYARAMPLDNLDRDSDLRTGTNFYTIGASKYFKGHDLKIQTDYTITDPVNGDLTAGLFRFQFEVAF